MSGPDLNLLETLDVLLSEGSVARAARRLRLSQSATSRALARLRDITGDPLLVRAGRGLVPTPRAAELRQRVSQVVHDARSLLRPEEAFDPGRCERTFVMRTRDGFVETFGPALLARLARDAPGIRMHFLPKADRESTLLREGTVDLETGVIGRPTSPEVRSQALFPDHFVGVVRAGHGLGRRPVDLDAYLAGQHIGLARHGDDEGPVEAALAALGLKRDLTVLVGGFSAALALARTSDRVATVPEAHTAGLRDGMHSFALPFDVPGFTVSLLWHPRLDADPAHRWLRACVREVCAPLR